MDERKSVFWTWVVGLYLLVIVVSAVLSVIFHGAEWNWGLALFLALVLYTITSFKTVGPTELGARLFLGRPIDQVSSGFVFVPAGIFTLELATRLVVQDELPSDPENIFRGDGPTPKGMFPPIRIPFGPPSKNDGIPLDDPYNTRMVAEVVPVVTWHIEDFVMFLTTIGSVKEARRQMEDAAIAMLTEAFAKITPAAALKDLATHSEDLKKAIDAKVLGWGINLKSSKIKPINFSHTLNTAILEVPEATVKAKAAIIIAEGEKRKRTLEGQGAGAAEKAVLDGRTAGLKNMMEKLDIKGHAVLAAETARGVTNNPGQKTIIAGSGGFSDLAVIGTVLGETLTNGMEAKNVV